MCREGCSNTVPVCCGEASAKCKCLIYQWVYPNLWSQALGRDRKQAAESGWSLRGRVRSSVTWENSEQWSSRTRASSGTWGTRIQNLGHLVSKVFWHVSPRAGPVVGSGHAGEIAYLSWPKNACLHLDELEEVAGRARSLLLHTMAPDMDGWPNCMVVDGVVSFLIFNTQCSYICCLYVGGFILMNIIVSDGFLKPLRPIGGSAVSVATPCSDLQCQ